jgi:hypothetical protein
LSVDPLELFGEAAALVREAKEYRAPRRVEHLALVDERPLVDEARTNDLSDGGRLHCT